MCDDNVGVLLTICQVHVYVTHTSSTVTDYMEVHIAINVIIERPALMVGGHIYNSDE